MEIGSTVEHADQNVCDPASQRGESMPPDSGKTSPLQKEKIPLQQSSLATIHDDTAQRSQPPVGGRPFHPDASLVLIGIRASGKRSLGLIAATALGRRFVTEDHFFQSINGLSRQDYLKANGNGRFHAQDIETSIQMLEDNRYKCVIECGLVSLTSSFQDYLRQYCEKSPVVFVLRDMEQIKILLNLDGRTTRMLEHGNMTHRNCSNFEFFNLEDQSINGSPDSDAADRTSPKYSFKLRNAQADFSSFVRFITGTHSARPTFDSPFSLDIPVELRAYTHALFLPMSKFVTGNIDFDSLESAGDLLEIYVDDWGSSTSEHLSKMVAVARRALRVPILLSANRRASEQSASDKYFAIMLQGLRLGVEYVSMDLDLENSVIQRLKAAKGYTKLIGNYVNGIPGEGGWKASRWMRLYNKAVALKLDLVRLLNNPISRHDNEAWSWFVEELKGVPGPQLVSITYNTGLQGRTSQIINPTLTSVTHPGVPTVEILDGSAPLLSARDITKSLFDCFVFDSLEFLIVGANVSESLSPAMHNAAYDWLGLRHHYNTRNINSWDDIEELARNDRLGGLSIVQPYKVRVVPKLKSLSGHAKAIGAVNTLIPLRANSSGVVPSLQVQAQERNRAGPIMGWFGENTDFIGIMNCVSGSLSPRNAIQPKTTALVIGAGGMARAAVYAMFQLGCRNLFVYNRTVENTRGIVRHFNHWAMSQSNGDASSYTPSPEPVMVLESLTDAWPSAFLLPPIIVSCVTHELLDGNPGASFEMPESWLQSPTGGVVVEMAYMTRETPLVKQMKRFREATRRPWVIIDGIETLIEQATAQFESMTGRKAPKRCMADAVHAALEENTPYLVDKEELLT
ncbi:hypothetical protein A1O1_00147 [Capronia coronata CBS 617.96]|uniref:Uncharacterized protein n=1 Tax=Capronia coronata CBS 617.96 TaxID=1182541 RepID=W9ZKJ7_9EURO|nr:uncharacterized protein A1O1_00147 [Capronia coronata CBS 617.96]EXJ95029.1 hypothetical protein A1O1_00147 [Capronia coronata CBS 617.96]